MAETDLILAAKATLVEPVMVDGEIGPITLDPNGMLRVSTKPGYFAPISGALTTSGNTLVADVSDASNVMLHVKNTGSAAMAAGAFVFEGSVDSTDGSDGTWFALQAVRSDSNTIENGRAASSLAVGTGQGYAWELSVNAVRWFRVRCTTSVTNNAIALWTIIRGTYASEPIPGIQPHAVTGSGTFNVSGSVTANSPTGTGFALISAASTNATLLRSSPCNLFELSVFNPTGFEVYIKLYDKASAPIVGTDVPIATISPNFTNVHIFGRLGKRFTTGLAIAMTQEAQANNTTPVSAGVQVSGTYI